MPTCPTRTKLLPLTTLASVPTTHLLHSWNTCFRRCYPKKCSTSRSKASWSATRPGWTRTRPTCPPKKWPLIGNSCSWCKASVENSRLLPPRSESRTRWKCLDLCNACRSWDRRRRRWSDQLRTEGLRELCLLRCPEIQDVRRCDVIVAAPPSILAAGTSVLLRCDAAVACIKWVFLSWLGTAVPWLQDYGPKNLAPSDLSSGSKLWLDLGQIWKETGWLCGNIFKAHLPMTVICDFL